MRLIASFIIIVSAGAASTADGAEERPVQMMRQSVSLTNTVGP